jgi:hypothetical protein
MHGESAEIMPENCQRRYVIPTTRERELRLVYDLVCEIHAQKTRAFNNVPIFLYVTWA